MSGTELQQKINDYIASSLSNFVVRNYEDAVRDLKSAEMLDRNNPEILYNLGVAYAQMGLYKTSIKYLLRVLDLPYTFVDILNVKKVIAYVYIKVKEFQKAAACLDELSKVLNRDISLYNMKGYCLEKQKKYFEAIKIYKHVINLDDNNYNAYNSLAYLFALTGRDLNSAKEYAERSYRSNKNNGAYLDTLGYVLLKMGDLKSAEKYLNKAKMIMPFSEEIDGHIKELRLALNNI